MCYTFNVEEKYRIWRIWTDLLQHWGLGHLAAGLLEAVEPINLVLAQFVYMGQPFFLSEAARQQLQALAALLEDRAEARSFITLLREEMLT